MYRVKDKNNVRCGSLHSLNLENFLWTELSSEVPNAPKKESSARMAVHRNKIFLFGGKVANSVRTNELHQFDLEISMSTDNSFKYQQNHSNCIPINYNYLFSCKNDN